GGGYDAPPPRPSYNRGAPPQRGPAPAPAARQAAPPAQQAEPPFGDEQQFKDDDIPF
ncbi:MAG: hypothetical protein JWO31_3375, partial [Phycisphaerales bacterium]|nr:hypothetical protein [Phycisphaerales bacterium]